MSEALLGVLIGGALGLLGSLVPMWWTHRQTRRTAQAVVVAYVRGLLDIAAARGHVASGRAMLAAWRGPDPDLKIIFYGTVDDPMMPEVISQLGALGPRDAAEAAIFLNILAAVRIDLRDMAEDGNFYKMPLDQRIARIEWDLDQWSRAEKIANGLIERYVR